MHAVVHELVGSAGCGGIARSDERGLLSDSATASGFSMTPAPPRRVTHTHAESCPPTVRFRALETRETWREDISYEI